MMWVLTLLPIAMLAFGFPIIVILLVAAGVVITLFTPVPPAALHQVLFGTLDSFTLLAIPFFIFAGEVMSRGGIAARIVDWTRCLFGRSKASLPLTTVGSMAMFGSISGSAPATIAAVGRITLKPMLEAGYDRRFAAGLLTASGVIDNVIPPSVAIIIYAAVAEVSVVKLFAAGIVPGILFALAFGLYVWLRAAGSEAQTGEPFSLRRLGAETRRSIWALGMPVVILGGIYGGVFSPTEAAGVAAVYAIVVSVLIHRELRPRDLLDCASQSAFVTAQLMFVIAAAGVFSWLLTISGTSANIKSAVDALQVSPWMILLVINVLLLIAGCFIDTASALLLLTPILLPVAVAAGVDPVHLGIVMTTNLSIGMFTPPFGVNIFVVQAVFNQPVGTIYRGVWPFVVLSVGVLMLITYVPELSLFLTRYL